MTRGEPEILQELSSALWKKHLMAFDEVVNRYGNPEGVFVDGGCDGERFLHRYADKFRYCIGFDIDLAGNLRNSDNIFYSYGDLENIPLRDNSVDVFLTNFVLEHIKHPERAFGEIGRVLKPNGVFISWTPNARSPSGTLLKILPVFVTRTLKRVLLKRSDCHPTYYRANTVSKLEKMMIKVGFRRINLQMIDGVFYLSGWRVVRWMHNTFARLSDHRKLRYFKDIIFFVYIKPENIKRHATCVGGASLFS